MMPRYRPMMRPAPASGKAAHEKRGPPTRDGPSWEFIHEPAPDSRGAGARQGGYVVGGSVPPACSSASRCAACRSSDSSSTAAVASSSAHRSPRWVE